MKTHLIHLLFLAVLLCPLASAQIHVEPKNAVSYLRGLYNIDFYRRHNEAYRTSAAVHFAHSKQHDILLLTPLNDAVDADQDAAEEFVDFLVERRARTGPEMYLYAPSTGRAMWTL